MRTKLPAVLVVAEKQRQLVDRLARHCEDLDGTKLLLLEGGPSTRLPYPKCNDAAFHQAAAELKGKAFFWMEPDAIPLKSNWLQTLTDEYYKAGKEFMLSSDSHPPFDAVGGIGVYGPNTHWFVPKTFEKNAWDIWMFKHAQEVTHWTPRIQHAYGRYIGGKSTPYIFPRDREIIRPESLIFHRDKMQTILNCFHND